MRHAEKICVSLALACALAWAIAGFPCEGLENDIANKANEISTR